MTKQVQKSLTELFMHLADAVDGGEQLPAHVKLAYLTEFKKSEMQAFYGRLVDENNKQLRLGRAAG